MCYNILASLIAAFEASLKAIETTNVPRDML
jgi:hypothetical protein